MLTTDAAVELYHRHAAKMPIIDYHCHLDPKMIARNHRFSGITEAWLGGDHYKWRAMRANGVSEEYITGSRSDYEKFGKWAETVPYTMRNPLYHWTHLELARLFGIDRVLSPATAREIYDACNAALATDAFTAQALMRRCNVGRSVRPTIRSIRWNTTASWLPAILPSGCCLRGVPTGRWP